MKLQSLPDVILAICATHLDRVAHVHLSHSCAQIRRICQLPQARPTTVLLIIGGKQEVPYYVAGKSGARTKRMHVNFLKDGYRISWNGRTCSGAVQMASSAHHRCDSFVATWRHYVFACGGMEQISSSSVMERYDMINNTWTVVPTHLFYDDNDLVTLHNWRCGDVPLVEQRRFQKINGHICYCDDNNAAIAAYDAPKNEWVQISRDNNDANSGPSSFSRTCSFFSSIPLTSAAIPSLPANKFVVGQFDNKKIVGRCVIDDNHILYVASCWNKHLDTVITQMCEYTCSTCTLEWIPAWFVPFHCVEIRCFYEPYARCLYVCCGFASTISVHAAMLSPERNVSLTWHKIIDIPLRKFYSLAVW